MTSAISGAPLAKHQSQPSPKIKDRWLWWPVATAIVSLAVISLLCGLPGLLSFILIPLSALVYLVISALLLIGVCVLVARRHLRKATSVLLALVVPIFAWVPVNWATECLHVGLTVGFGVGQLGRGPPSDGRPFAIYDWSVGLAGGPNTFLIHDVTGKIARPPKQNEHPPLLENGFAEACAGRVTRLLGHYYVCNTE